MDHILLCTDNIPQVTSIHNSFIENYMLSANGSYVKVYLYLAKCIQSGDQNLSISSLADQMENTEKDVIRALLYWEKSGLVKLSRTQDDADITGIELLNPDSLSKNQENKAPVIPVSFTKKPSKAVSEESATAEKNTTVNQPVSTEAKTTDVHTESKQTPSQQAAARQSNVSPFANSQAKQAITVTEEQTDRLAKDEQFIWTVRVVENYLQRTIKPNELQLISYLYDTLNFSSELILHLYDYCISKGKTGNNYIQTVALAWHEDGIKTPDDAIKASSNYNAYHSAITKALALDRTLATSELDFVNRWQNEWHMDLAVILEACKRTMMQIHKGDFHYVDGILSKWHKNKVQTLQDIQEADTLYEKKKKVQNAEKKTSSYSNTRNTKNQFSSFEQREMSKSDIDLLEQKLINK